MRVIDYASKCRNNMIMMAQLFFFFFLLCAAAYMYVKGCAICQAKGFYFAVKPPACGSCGSTCVLNSLTSFKSFDVIEVSVLLLMTL